MDRGYKIVEHTADLALRAYGHDLRELIENAAQGMLALLYAEPPPEPAQTLELPVAGDGPEVVLQRSLRELLYLLEDEGLAPVQVAVAEADERRATLKVGVIPRAQAEPLIGAAIKAITRHGLEIVRHDDRLEVTIVFDV
jgi:SHS2 domain-containing protein